MDRQHLIIGSATAGLAVVLGAFGAHALEQTLELNQRTETYDTAVLYHMFHALGILFVGVLMSKKPHQLLKLISYMFLFGIIVFSGSLYVLSVSGVTALGMITPIGGLLMISGWALLIVYLFRHY